MSPPGVFQQALATKARPFCVSKDNTVCLYRHWTRQCFSTHHLRNAAPVQGSTWVITLGCSGIWLECDCPELSICSQADATALPAPIPMNGPSQPMQQVPAFSMPNGAMSLPPLQDGIPAAMADNYQVSPAPGVGFCQLALQECVNRFVCDSVWLHHAAMGVAAICLSDHGNSALGNRADCGVKGMTRLSEHNPMRIWLSMWAGEGCGSVAGQCRGQFLQG